ncbi:Solute carrier family 35 member E3 [Scedosporium apiospermum]|uniref:GDP-mannose transporter n=1 Tax=Pseudallescheria apiosperma TaxID=563466 RepID=A0A084G6E1_PSEDA|nr:Solute carrier family 35 member E3 [Scedosporium apiospermum]KEZ42903.1 Solute carrier family 35 member E3 [Scedosporium apiospermum]
MAEGSSSSAPKSPSISSSTTMEEHEKLMMEMSELDDNGNPKRSTDLEFNKREEEENLLPGGNEKPAEPAKSSFRAALTWMGINTLATVGIVFTNKAIFSDPQFKLCQLSFACFHFTVTFLTLFMFSRPPFNKFTPRRVPFKTMLPLCITMCLNVILPNFSLAFSSVTFYQLARILLTPVVALMNFILYRATLPRKAILTLIPVCVGVGVVSYYDSLPTDNAKVKTTSPLGVLFAFSGVFASSLYTVWIGSYHRKLEMNSMQLLFNQAPWSAFMLLYVIPFVDRFPTLEHTSFTRWFMILLSGLFASLINISQFFIIAQTGAVSSTVVGHLKTCTIVALGWIVSGRSVGDKSIFGVIMAIGGITLYYIVMTKHNRAKAGQTVK